MRAVVRYLISISLLFLATFSHAVGIISSVTGSDFSEARTLDFARPTAIALDRNDNLFFAVLFDDIVVKVNGFGDTTLIAGSGLDGYSGDGGLATEAKLSNPAGLCVDNIGNTYIADTDNHRIRKVDSNGIITTIVGTGTAGYGGDGSLAVEAKINSPYGLSLDEEGNLYFADYQNHRIRKVDSKGVITTIAGTGTAGFSGDDGLAIHAQLNFPSGVKVDEDGNVFIADKFNHRIRKIGLNGIITTIAGTNTYGFNGDSGLALETELFYPSNISLDTAGNLYLSDYYNHRISKVDSNGLMSAVVGQGSMGYSNGFSGDGGEATNAKLAYPSDLAFDSRGNLYVADQSNDRIRMVNSEGIITTIVSNLPGFSGDQGWASKS
jgi:sugar lactone lactonase YvrE